MDLIEMLDLCLERRREGASLEDCLALFPEQAGQLAPLVAVAGQFSAVRGAAIPAAVRAQAKAQLRGAAAAQAGTAPTPWSGWLKGWFTPRSWGLAQGLVTLLLVVACLASLATAAAASGPGDPAYGMRVIIERVPARLILDPAARAEAELAISERRLAELRQELARDGQTDDRALAALLAGDEAALRAALRVSGRQRDRIAAAIGLHAQALGAMATTTAAKPAAGALQRAASQAGALQDAGSDPGAGLWLPGTPGPGPDDRPAVPFTPAASATPAAPEIQLPPATVAPGFTPLPAPPTSIVRPTTLPIYQMPDRPRRPRLPLHSTVVPARQDNTLPPAPMAGTPHWTTPGAPAMQPRRGHTESGLPGLMTPEPGHEPPPNQPATPARGEPRPTRAAPQPGPQPPAAPPPDPPPTGPSASHPEPGQRPPGPKH